MDVLHEQHPEVFLEFSKEMDLLSGKVKELKSFE